MAYGIFQGVFLLAATNSPQNSTTVTELVQNRQQAKNTKKACFCLPILTFVFFTGSNDCSSELSKFRTLEHFYNLFPDTNFNTEILNMSKKFRTYGNPRL